MGTFAVVRLGAYVTRDAKARAVRTGGKGAYRKGFVDTLFNLDKPGYGPGLAVMNPTLEEREVVNRLWAAGRKDAIELARTALSKQQVQVDPHWDDEQRAFFYGKALKRYYRSTGRDAEGEIGENVRKRAEALMQQGERLDTQGECPR